MIVDLFWTYLCCTSWLVFPQGHRILPQRELNTSKNIDDRILNFLKNICICFHQCSLWVCAFRAWKTIVSQWTLQWKATKIFPLWNVISLCFSRVVICGQYTVKCKNHSQEIEKSPDANFLFRYNAEVAFCYSKKTFH